MQDKHLTEAEQKTMAEWGMHRLINKELCKNQKASICLCSTTDKNCVLCWRKRME